MSTTARPVPTTDDDLLGLRLAHRMMRRDARRLAELTARWAAGTETITGRRARDLRTWTDRLCDEIHHHHTAEDEILWPVLEEFAGAVVDLTELSGDHAALDPVLDDLRTLTREAVAGTKGPEALAARWRTLADELDEHIEAEERELFGVITAHVPLDRWRRVEEGVRGRGGDMMFLLPRLGAVVTAEEMARLRAEAGPVLMVLLRIARWRHRPVACRLFGTDD